MIWILALLISVGLNAIPIAITIHEFHSSSNGKSATENEE